MFAMTVRDAKMAKTKTMNIFKTGVRAGGVWVFSIVDAKEQDTEVTVVGGAVVTVDMFFRCESDVFRLMINDYLIP